ncbi:hypothetical protein A2865_02635 [Candidatus Woesebacteria bacterium RIFCSPHIGHO2_01_FULL_39_17]|nr:MAG: hypothetical protein A2865_02635 [Candidatus Woesebacteria bacterium RIFCSPHIGHO2_01_FULL_39_17]
MKINKDELQLAEAFIDEHFSRIVDWAVGDIKRCCRMNEDGTCDESGALVGAFILWCCAIDYFGGLFTSYTSQGATKARFRSFIKAYMDRYDSEKVIELRWSILHFYSPHFFLLYHENNLEQNKNLHLTATQGGIYLHLGWAIKDLEDAVKRYWDDLKVNKTLKIKAWRYYKEYYPIMPIRIENFMSQRIFNSLPTGAQIQSVNVSWTISQDSWLKTK